MEDCKREGGDREHAKKGRSQSSRESFVESSLCIKELSKKTNKKGREKDLPVIKRLAFSAC